jgi:hypothetical protein
VYIWFFAGEVSKRGFALAINNRANAQIHVP